MRYAILLISALVISAALFSTLYAAEDAPAVISVAGDPQIMKKGADAWSSATVDTALETGDRVKTKAGENLQIAYAGRSNFIKVNENSDVVLLIGRDGGSIELLNGEALALIKKLPKGSTFEMKTPSGVSGARGTGLGAQTDGRQSRFSTFEGTGYVKGYDRAGGLSKDETIVDAGFRASIQDRFERPGGIDRIPEDKVREWNSFREDIDRSSHEREAGRGASGGGQQQIAQAPKVAETAAPAAASSERQVRLGDAADRPSPEPPAGREAVDREAVAGREAVDREAATRREAMDREKIERMEIQRERVEKSDVRESRREKRDTRLIDSELEKSDPLLLRRRLSTYNQ